MFEGHTERVQITCTLKTSASVLDIFPFYYKDSPNMSKVQVSAPYKPVTMFVSQQTAFTGSSNITDWKILDMFVVADSLSPPAGVLHLKMPVFEDNQRLSYSSVVSFG